MDTLKHKNYDAMIKKIQCKSTASPNFSQCDLCDGRPDKRHSRRIISSGTKGVITVNKGMCCWRCCRSVLVLHSLWFACFLILLLQLLLLTATGVGHSSATTTKQTYSKWDKYKLFQLITSSWNHHSIYRAKADCMLYIYVVHVSSYIYLRKLISNFHLPRPAPPLPLPCCLFCWLPPRPRPFDTTSSFTMSMISSGIRRYLMVLPLI